MLFIALCFYTAFVATIGAIVVRIGLIFVSKPNILRGLGAIAFLQVLLGVSYMMLINFDAAQDARIAWPMAIICGVLGGLLSLIPATQILRFRR